MRPFQPEEEVIEHCVSSESSLLLLSNPSRIEKQNCVLWWGEHGRDDPLPARFLALGFESTPFYECEAKGELRPLDRQSELVGPSKSQEIESTS